MLWKQSNRNIRNYTEALHFDYPTVSLQPYLFGSNFPVWLYMCKKKGIWGPKFWNVA